MAVVAAVTAEAWQPPDTRRRLQLALGAVWLLDALLQYQAFMFSKGFGQMLAATAPGNPAVVAVPITWSAGIIEAHPGPVNAAFATIQLLLGLGIIWRPAVRAALAASVMWSVAVWWLGEGLGGVVNGTGTAINGAPGAVILYALLAVLLWPARTDRRVLFEAARAVGPRAARLLWLVLWGSMAWFAVGPAASRSAQGIPVSITLAITFAVVAAGIYAPRTAARAALALAIVAAAVIWAAGQDFGGIFTGSATDPNSAPLLIMLAVAYWPAPETDRLGAGAPAIRGRVPGTAHCPDSPAAGSAYRREAELDASIVHLVMAVAMAGMLVPSLSIGPPALWAGVFAACAAWFGWQTVRVWAGLATGRWRCPFPVPHLAECLAMVYMLVAVKGVTATGSGTGMAGMGGTSAMMRVPELAVVFALFLVGYVAWLGDRLTFRVTRAYVGTCCYKIAMALVMGYMLIVAL